MTKEQNVKDQLLRYGIMLGKRCSEKQKLRFLRIAQKQLEEAGFSVEITKAEVALGKQDRHRFYNLYAGDWKQAKVLLTTYYDTGCVTWPSKKAVAFTSGYTPKDARIQLIGKLILLLVMATLLYVGVYPLMRTQGMLSIGGLWFLLLVFGFFYVMKHYREGVPKGKNMIRNSSSLIALFAYLQELPREERDLIAIALVDEGTRFEYGQTMLQEYLGKRSIPRLYMDSIGNPGAIHCFSTHAKLKQATSFAWHPLAKEQKSYGDMLMTAGTCVDGEVVVQEKEELQEEQLMKAIQAIQECVSLVLNT